VCLWLALCASLLVFVPRVDAALRAGAAQVDITPPAGTPSAGYGDRRARGMEGVHDPLLATALVIDNGETMLAFVGVDHLGFHAAMVASIRQIVHANEATARCLVFVGSSHTHSGGGAYLDIPGLGEALAGRFDEQVVRGYVAGAARAIIDAAGKMEDAKTGVGHGHAPGMSGYRGDWPPGVQALDDVTVIKVTKADDSPLAVLFSFAAHPTVLGGGNMHFSADFVGYARTQAARLIGGGVQPVFFNGAQGDVSPRAPLADDPFERCESMGAVLADQVKGIWDRTEATADLKIETLSAPYDLDPQPTTSGLVIPGGSWMTELNAIVFNDRDAFITIPGELSCIYDADIKRFGGWLGFRNVSILGLTNDAHGYIVTPESYRHRTYESTLSFGGELYGERIESMALALLHALEPAGAYNEERLVESTALQDPCSLGAAPPERK